MGSQRRRQPQHTMHQRWMSTSKRNRTTSQKERGRRKKSGRRGDTTRCDSSRSRSARIESNRIAFQSNRCSFPLFPIAVCIVSTCVLVVRPVRMGAASPRWSSPRRRAMRAQPTAAHQQPPPSSRPPRTQAPDQRRTAPTAIRMHTLHACTRRRWGKEAGRKKTRHSSGGQRAAGRVCWLLLLPLSCVRTDETRSARQQDALGRVDIGRGGGGGGRHLLCLWLSLLFSLFLSRRSGQPIAEGKKGKGKKAHAAQRQPETTKKMRRTNK